MKLNVLSHERCLDDWEMIRIRIRIRYPPPPGGVSRTNLCMVKSTHPFHPISGFDSFPILSTFYSYLGYYASFSLVPFNDKLGKKPKKLEEKSSSSPPQLQPLSLECNTRNGTSEISPTTSAVFKYRQDSAHPVI